MAEFLKKCCIALKIRIIWIVCRLFPINNKKITVSNYYGRGYGDNAKYIVESLLKKNDKIRIIWLIKDDIEKESLPERVEPCRINTVKSVYHLMTSKIWLDNCRKFFIKFKRQEQFYIQTWHGFALKQIEKDAQAKLSPDYVKLAKRDSENTDVIISCSRFMTSLYQNSFWYNGNILEIGAPRNDILLIKDNNLKKKVYDYLGIDEGKGIVLYAPTFRVDKKMSAYSLDYKRLKNVCKRRFGKDFVIVTRLHPNIANQSSELDKNSDIINGSFYPDMQELMLASDIIITDYSSVMFDFSLMYKPCFQFATDISEYKNDRGFYFKLDELPFSISSDNDELEKNILEFSEKIYMEKLAQFHQKIGVVTEGKASEKCADMILEKCYEEYT